MSSSLDQTCPSFDHAASDLAGARRSFVTDRRSFDALLANFVRTLLNLIAAHQALIFVGDLLHDRLALTKHLAVGKADHSVAQIIEVSRSRLIVFDLIGVGIAVDFDDQFCFGAEEIDDVRADGMLLAPVQTVDLAPAQMLPEFLFGRCEVFAKFARPLLNLD
jgi:hypothetical protein